MATDPFDLERFVTAQNPQYATVREELERGEKTSHWIWFIFPQFKGLGFSLMANHYGIASEEEAKAYLNHPILGSRLLECTALVNQVENKRVEQIFGGVDAMKFRSSMSLFAHVAPGEPLFREAIDKFFGGEPDGRTLSLLGR